MSELFVCGTGGWNGPKPGDPDNNLVLRAVPAFGGVDVSWTYPDRNPEAVAHTILFRGISGIFAGAAKHAIVSGNFFYDKTTTDIPLEYYYWIQVVSVNGTYGELIGPAKATARPLIAEMIQQLTGQIDSGVLAQSLKQSLDQITLNKLGITQEMLDRDAADETLGVALNEVTAHSGETRALLQQEVLARAEANEAFVSAVNTIYAELGTGLAAVQKVQAALVTSSKAQASDITQVQSTLNGDTAAGRIGLTTIVEKHGNTLTNIGALYTAQVQVNGLIGGFGVYNDGRTVEAGFDVDRFWIGRTNASKRKPFIIDQGIVYIDDAAIRQLTVNKIRSEDGTSLVFENNKLKAQFIGPITFESLTGAKPPSNADKTSLNTAYDTNRVNGSSAVDVVNWAKTGQAGAQRVNDWIRPATTLINGNKIYTGDAYVDTLQIRGNAVTVPTFAQAYEPATSGSWMTVLEVWIGVDQACWLYGSSSGYISYGRGWGDTQSRLMIDGQLVSYGGGSEAWTSASHSGAVYVGPGYRQIALQFMSPSGKGTINTRALFGMAVKR